MLHDQTHHLVSYLAGYLLYIFSASRGQMSALQTGSDTLIQPALQVLANFHSTRNVITIISIEQFAEEHIVYNVFIIISQTR
jgi:hypothetical protein